MTQGRPRSPNTRFSISAPRNPPMSALRDASVRPEAERGPPGSITTRPGRAAGLHRGIAALGRGRLQYGGAGPGRGPRDRRSAPGEHAEPRAALGGRAAAEAAAGGAAESRAPPRRASPSRRRCRHRRRRHPFPRRTRHRPRPRRAAGPRRRAAAATRSLPPFPGSLSGSDVTC